MSALDSSWSFLKSEWKDMKRDLDNQRRQDEQQPLRKPFTQPYTEAEKDHLRELLGQQDEARAAAASQTDVAMDRVSTTPSTGQMENPAVQWDPAAVEALRQRNKENR